MEKLPTTKQTPFEEYISLEEQLQASSKGNAVKTPEMEKLQARQDYLGSQIAPTDVDNLINDLTHQERLEKLLNS